METNNDYLLIDTQTIGKPALKMWIRLCDKYIGKNTYEITYTAEGPSDRLYITNDPNYIGKYCLTSFTSEIESAFNISEDVLKKELTKFLNIKEDLDLKLLRELALKRQGAPCFDIDI